MQGFVRFHIPLWVRRSVTMLPSFVVILMGLDPTQILVMSGAAEFWYCAGAGAAADLYQQQNSDGRAGQLNAGETNRVGHRGGGRGAEPVVVSGNCAGSLTKKGAVEAL